MFIKNDDHFYAHYNVMFFMVMAFVLASCMVVSIIRRCSTSDCDSDADDDIADGAGDDVAEVAWDTHDVDEILLVMMLLMLLCMLMVLTLMLLMMLIIASWLSA